MRPDAAHEALTCSTCHRPHRDDTRSAAVDACLGCHADRHSRAFKGSPHEALWQGEFKGDLPPGSGVSCASCHMPRVRIATEQGSRMSVQHNQNDTLQPNEKMARPVCMNCHGLGFTLDALADDELIARNFKGAPSRHVPSIDMALKKQLQERARRGSTQPTQ
jgi:hypothetical protein